MSATTTDDDQPASDREHVTTRLLAWPRERVVRAWTEASHLSRWWGPRGFSSTFQEFEPRAGGRWRLVLHGPDGTDYPNVSVFVEVSPARVVLDHVSGHRFRLSAGGTLLTWCQRFETAAEFERVRRLVVPANEQNLDRLEAELATMG